MKALLIGGTGTISSAISELLLQQGWQLSMINRGNRVVMDGVDLLKCDITDEDSIRQWLKNKDFDVVADFIAFRPEDVQRDIRLFSNITNQYIFISSASAYQKPLSDYQITESTPLSNPYWEYSRNKIACEECLMEAYRNEGFPITIVRPSHTYGNRSVPVGLHGKKGSWQVIKRIRDGKPVIVHGDGSSLWTMTHNTDFARGFVGLMGNIHAIGQAVHITSDESVTWNQIYQVIYNYFGKQPNVVHIASDLLAECGAEYDFRGSLLGDKACTVSFDNSKLKRLVPGFEATVRLDQGILQTLDFVLSHPEVQAEDPVFDTWCDRLIDAYRNIKI